MMDQLIYKEHSQKFKNINISYVKQNNSGANAARNRGEKEILDHNKYVIFMDSDDTFVDKNSIKMMVDDIQKHPKI